MFVPLSRRARLLLEMSMVVAAPPVALEAVKDCSVTTNSRYTPFSGTKDNVTKLPQYLAESIPPYSIDPWLVLRRELIHKLKTGELI